MSNKEKINKAVFAAEKRVIEKQAKKHALKKALKKAAKIHLPKAFSTAVAKLPNTKDSMHSFARADVTMATTAAILHPFRAAEAQLKVGLPFDQTASSYMGFWTRDIINVSAVLCTGTTDTYSAVFFAAPWCADSNVTVSALSSVGVPSTVINSNSSGYGFITGSFDKAVVTHMGMRVRNISPVLYQNGDLTVGSLTYENMMSCSTENRRINGLSYTRAAAGSGVTAEMTWIGNTDSDEAKLPAIDDYVLCDTSGDTFDEDLTLLYLSANCSDESLFEVEIVRHYLLVPTLANLAFFPVERNSVNVNKVLDQLDLAYSRVPRFDLKRCAIPDDGDVFDDMKGVWKGLKALTRLPGSLWQAASSIGDTATLQKFKDVVRAISSEDYALFVESLNRFPDKKSFITGVSTMPIKTAPSVSSSSKRH